MSTCELFTDRTDYTDYTAIKDKLKIATITLGTNISTCVDIVRLSLIAVENWSVFESVGWVSFWYKVGHCVWTMGDYKVKSDKSFRNCMTIRILLPGMSRVVGVKLFSSGALHIAGCLKEREGEMIRDHFREFFPKVFAELTFTPSEVKSPAVWQPKSWTVYESGVVYAHDEIIGTVHTDKENIVMYTQYPSSKKFVWIQSTMKFHSSRNLKKVLDTEQSKTDNPDNTENTQMIGQTSNSFEKFENYDNLGKIVIYCINSVADFKRQIPLMALWDKLRLTHQIVHFQPEIYAGLKWTFRFPLGKTSTESVSGSCTCANRSGCICEHLCIIIFQKGKVMITGARSIERIGTALKSITDVINTL